jgi:hypothetical protein
MEPPRLGDMQKRAQRDVVRLAEHERDHLAHLVITLGYIRRATLSDPYYREAFNLIADLAPSLAAQVRAMIETTDTYHRRIHG